MMHPDIELVLMDIKMPRMGGFEATGHIKRSRPDLPVIALDRPCTPGRPGKDNEGRF
jgi:CheY-like chemotaxis protein